MIRLCLCDDNEKDLSRIGDRIADYAELRSLSGELSLMSYSVSRELWFHLDDSKTPAADIYILDIDMPGMDGMELASAIRKKRPGAIIFFLTSHSEYASEGYLVGAIRYILKSEDPQPLYEALDAAITEYHTRTQECLTVLHHRDVINIPLTDIVYVERVGRILYIHTRSEETYEDNRPLTEMQELLSPAYFVLIDRGTIVNANFIQKTDANRIYMFNGMIFTISKRRIADAKKAIADAWILRSRLI